MARARHLRIAHLPGTPKPWVVQYSTPDAQTWTDVYRFDNAATAVEYAEDIRRRDRILLGALR